jgi:hypothetical protein
MTEKIIARPCEPTKMSDELLKRVEGPFLDRLYKYRNMGLPMHSDNVSVIADEVCEPETFSWPEIDEIAMHCSASQWDNS